MSSKLRYAGPLEFGDQYLTAEEYARVIGKHPQHVRRMVREMVFADFGIPIVSIPQGKNGRYRQVYIFSPATVRS